MQMNSEINHSKKNYLKGCYYDNIDPMVSIIDYLKMKEIEYTPINIQVINGKKKLSYARPPYRTNDFDYEEGRIAISKRKQQLKAGVPYTHVAIDTSKVLQIDIDCEEYDDIFKNLVKNFPYTKSTTKPYGKHIFVINESIKPEFKKDGKINRHKRVFKKEFGVTSKGSHGVELLNGLWAWCPIDAVVYNYQKSMHCPINLNDLLESKKSHKLNSIKKTKKIKMIVKKKNNNNKKIPKKIYSLEDIIIKNINKDNLTNDTKHQDDILKIIFQYYNGTILDDRDNWMRFTFACNHLGINKDLWNEICIQYDNYDMIDNENFYNNINPNNAMKCGWNTLINLTDLDDEVKELFKIVNGLSPVCEYTQIDYADILYLLYGNDYLYSNGICCWNDETKLWERDNDYLFDLQIKFFIKTCKKGYLNYQQYQINKLDENEVGYQSKVDEIKKMMKIPLNEINKLCNIDTIGKIRKMFHRIIKHKNKVVKGKEIDYNEISKSLIQFKNGCYDLKNNIFRERLRDDRVSICLDWEYSDIQNHKLISKIDNEIFKKIQPDEIQYDMMMSFLGYGLTGETEQQRFITNIGYTASNGKSLIQTILCKSFNIYCHKVSGDIYSTASKYRQKELAELITRPIRLLFTGEMTDKKLDNEFIKDFVDGESINIKALYKDSCTIRHHAKLLQNSNHDLNCKNSDAGILRRCIIQFYNSRFIDESEGKIQPDKHIYKKNKQISYWFQDDDYKLALFHLLTKYITAYYKNGLVIHKDIEANTKNIFDENDELTERLCTEFKITKNTKDLVNRNELYETLGLNYYEKKEIHKYLKSKGIQYLKNKMKNGMRGFYSGIKRINMLNYESDSSETDYNMHN
tara:strand:+ start:1722 stop:4298 length:2577 start_codon:yes stop_codon:yes gene_type:complete